LATNIQQLNFVKNVKIKNNLADKVLMIGGVVQILKQF
jgi:hypothetical protein